MPAQTTALTEDQAEDLRELLGYVAILEDWLLHAPDETINELADAAYHGHFHPRSAAWWLIEDIGHLGTRLRKVLPGRLPEQSPPAAAPGFEAGPEAEARTIPSSSDPLDTPTSIGNHSRARHAGRRGKHPTSVGCYRPVPDRGCRRKRLGPSRIESMRPLTFRGRRRWGTCRWTRTGRSAGRTSGRAPDALTYFRELYNRDGEPAFDSVAMSEK